MSEFELTENSQVRISKGFVCSGVVHVADHQQLMYFSRQVFCQALRASILPSTELTFL